LAHFRGQLAYHLAVLKLRRAKSEPGEWHRAVRVANPLLFLATKRTNIIGRPEGHSAARWREHGAERVTVANHVLLAQIYVKPNVLTEVSMYRSVVQLVENPSIMLMAMN